MRIIDRLGGGGQRGEEITDGVNGDRDREAYRGQRRRRREPKEALLGRT
jgi:hypothetical protein